MDILDSESLDEGGRDTLSGAAIGNQFAQHGSKTENDHQETQDIADASLNGTGNRGDRHSFRQANTNGNDDKSDECVDFKITDHENQQKDADDDNG